MSITIALDVMGGDHGPRITLPAARKALANQPELNLILVGLPEVVDAAMADTSPALQDRMYAQHASQTVGMDEPPAKVLRGKKDSSMRVAINLVRDGKADACVSAANTGALMATARFVLKTLPGIDRPAFVSAMPSMRGHSHMLDLGANVDSPASLLLQFGIMGSVLVKAIEGIPEPTVALLNIGVEDIKGNNIVKQAAELLRNSNLNYVGYVEADAIYTGDVDVIVCDGFDGNVALKASEGLAQLIHSVLKEEYGRNLLTRLSGLMSLGVLRKLNDRMDPRKYNGASLLGLRGTVVKSHGGADEVALEHAIELAIAEIRNRVPEKIGHELEIIRASETMSR